MVSKALTSLHCAPVTKLIILGHLPACQPEPLPLFPEPTAKDLCPGRKAQGFSKVLPGTCSALAEGRRGTRSRDARFSSIIHHSGPR